MSENGEFSCCVGLVCVIVLGHMSRSVYACVCNIANVEIEKYIILNVL